MLSEKKIMVAKQFICRGIFNDLVIKNTKNTNGKLRTDLLPNIYLRSRRKTEVLSYQFLYFDAKISDDIKTQIRQAFTIENVKVLPNSLSDLNESNQKYRNVVVLNDQNLIDQYANTNTFIILLVNGLTPSHPLTNQHKLLLLDKVCFEENN